MCVAVSKITPCKIDFEHIFGFLPPPTSLKHRCMGFITFALRTFHKSTNGRRLPCVPSGRLPTRSPEGSYSRSDLKACQKRRKLGRLDCPIRAPQRSPLHRRCQRPGNGRSAKKASPKQSDKESKTPKMRCQHQPKKSELHNEPLYRMHNQLHRLIRHHERGQHSAGQLILRSHLRARSTAMSDSITSKRAHMASCSALDRELRTLYPVSLHPPAGLQPQPPYHSHHQSQ